MQLHYCTAIFVVLMCAVLRPEPQGQKVICDCTDHEQVPL